MVKKGKGKAIVVHIDRMRKLPVAPDAESEECPLNDKRPTTAVINQSTKRPRVTDTEGTSTHRVDTSSHSDSVDRQLPLIYTTDNLGSDSASLGRDLDTGDVAVPLCQSADVAAAETGNDTINALAELLPIMSDRPQRVRRTLSRLLTCIQSCVLIDRKFTRACADRLVNNVFVSGASARVVVVEGSFACVD